MKLYKKIILFILLFLFLLCLNKTVFGVTLTEIEYNGVIFKPDVEPLTLQTTTNSYLIAISKDLTCITVVEPYNNDDYLVSSSSTSISSGTYNRISGYSTSTKSITDIYCYTSVCSNGIWSTWSKSSASQLGSVAPGNTSNIIVKKSNIALYCNGLGIVGNDIISTGIPLPAGISLTDNISISKRIYSDYGNLVNYYYLCYTKNTDNIFDLATDDWIYCKTPSLSQVYFDIYEYKSNSKNFEFWKNSQKVYCSGTHSVLYSYNDFTIDGKSYAYASKNFFDISYEDGEYIFPYIADTDEVLSNLDNTEKILIFPGNIVKENLPLTFSLFDVTNNKDICSITLDTNSPHYLYIVENPDDYWFEIPTSEFKDYLINGNQYLFNIIARNNVNEFTISRNITYSGTSGTPPTEEDKQTDAIINQTEKIEEQTNAIVNQTEKIEEQTEVQKSIFERIGDILSYINPLSENFFAYKLVDLLIDALKSLFVPEERFF